MIATKNIIPRSRVSSLARFSRSPESLSSRAETFQRSNSSAAAQVSHRVNGQTNGVKVSPSKPISHSWRPTNSNKSQFRWPVTFYSQKEIARVAGKSATRLTPIQLVYAGKMCNAKYVLQTANYLHTELPIRCAKIIRQFQQLPHIVGINPYIQSIHELYVQSYQRLMDVKMVQTAEEETAFSHLLRNLLDEHKDTITTLAHGFRECRTLLTFDEIREFLDPLQTSRLGIRMLAEHHLALHHQRPGHIGIVQTKLSPKEVIEDCASFARNQCEQRFGRAPRLDIDGETGVHFAYIASPFQYILEELIKNAMRATAEVHRHRMHLPPVTVTICNNSHDFTIRVSDVGGGIPADEIANVWRYMYSTADESSALAGQQSSDTASNGVDRLVTCMSRPAAGPMAGFGFGLPTSRAYARYLGGELSIQSMFGLGTDVFLQLKHFDSPHTNILL